MRIGQFAKRFGVDTRTIDFYTKTEGLLKPKAIPGSKYRDYDEECERTLFKILIFRDVGLSISEIRDALDDPSYLTRERLDTHIAAMKEHRDTEIRRYNEMIEFAEVLRDTSLFPTRALPLLGFPYIPNTMKLVTASLGVVNDKQDSLLDKEETEEFRDLIIALLSNLQRRKEDSPQSPEVQQIIHKAVKRLERYAHVELYLALSATARIDPQVFETVGEDECDKIDSTDWNLIKQCLQICADWCLEAKTQERILDFNAFKEACSEKVRELDRQVRAIDKNQEVSALEDLFEMLKDICKERSESTYREWASNLLIGLSSSEELDEAFGEGISQFLYEAVEFYKTGGN